MRARQRSLFSALALVVTSGCSYGFGDLEPTYARADGGIGVDAIILPGDPRFAMDPAWPCNPVSNLGCSAGSCSGDIQSNAAITDLRCRTGSGSGSFDTYCADVSFCASGFLCWTDPNVPSASDGSCAEPCFDSSDCAPGSHCQTTSFYRATYGTATMYRCVPNDD